MNSERHRIIVDPVRRLGHNRIHVRVLVGYYEACVVYSVRASLVQRDFNGIFLTQLTVLGIVVRCRVVCVCLPFKFASLC